MKIINCLLLLQIIFIFSAVKQSDIVTSPTQTGNIPTVGISYTESITTAPSIEPIPFTSCQDVYDYMLPRLGAQRASTMTRIARLESNCNPLAKNPSSAATGLFQIMSVTTWNYAGCTGDIYDPWDNMECAIKVYNLQGFEAWAVY